MRDMTDTEKRHVERNKNCPACQGRLMSGPSGGMCVNFKCESCERVWNLCFGFGANGGIFTGQLVQGEDYEQMPADTDYAQYVEEDEPEHQGFFSRSWSFIKNYHGWNK